MPKNLKIMSLNAGRMLQERTRAFLQDLATDESRPDILCLQDFPFRDMVLLERWPHIAFAPMTNHLINGMRAVVGIVIASRYLMPSITHHTTWGDGTLKDLQGINDQNQRHLGAKSDTLVEATEDRVAICATVVKDNIRYNIATTHGMWARNSVTNDVQRKCMKRTRDSLNAEAVHRHGLVLAGDMNFGRGGEIYSMFTNVFRDCVPPEVDNTLDPKHPIVKKGIRVVSDYVMTHDDGIFPGVYDVTDVRLHSGASDHCALSATVSKS